MASNELIVVQKVMELNVLLMYCYFGFVHQERLLQQVPVMISELSGFDLSKCLFISTCVCV